MICLIINSVGKKFLGFDLGFTLLIVNGLLTFFSECGFSESKQDKFIKFAEWSEFQQ